MEIYSETNEISDDRKPKVSEGLSPKGREVMQGIESNSMQSLAEKKEATDDIPAENQGSSLEIKPAQNNVSEVKPIFNPNPPPEHQPQFGIGEKGIDNKIQTGPEKTEKKIFTGEENEKGKPGGLDYYPRGYEKGG